MSTKTQAEPMNTIQVKRAITRAGKLQDAIKPLAAELKKELAALKYEISRDLTAGSTKTVVSTQYAATLGAERQERIFTRPAKLIVFNDIELSDFLDLVSLPIGQMNKLYSESQLDAIAPKEYSGGGRVFKLSKLS